MKKIVLLLALLCVLIVVASCNNQLTDSTLESIHKNDAPNQPVTVKPDVNQSLGSAFQKQTLNIGQAYNIIKNAAPKSSGRIVAKDDQIIYIDYYYSIKISNPDGSEATTIFTSGNKGCVWWLTLYEDDVFFIDVNNGLYSIIDNEPKMLVEGDVWSFEINGGKIFYNIADQEEKTNQMYVCDLDGSNQKMIASLDNRSDIVDIFKATGEILGQKDQVIYYSVREEVGFQYYIYDLAADSHKKIDIEKVNKEEIGYYKIPYDTVCVNGIRFAVEWDADEKYTLSITDIENGTVYAQTRVNGDIIHLNKNILYISSEDRNIEYFELGCE